MREPEWALVTVLFVDIRGFTTFADRATARDAAAFLRGFFDFVVPIVGEHDGEVMQLLGDGMLAVFRTADHANRALAAGTAMAAGRFRLGVGINSGLVLAGVMGGGGFEREGVVGDPVNVAARVQDAARDLGEALLLTEATRMLLDAPPELVPHGALQLRGKRKPIAVYGLPVTLSGRQARRTDSDVGTH